MSARMHNPLAGALIGAFLLAPVCPAAGPLKFSGSIGGVVSNSAGTPQMGATILLYNRNERLLQKAISDEKGVFTFASLVPDVYAIRVSMASFLPALKRNISVQPGMQSLLNVSLNSVFSSIELVAHAPGQSAVMSDEWKWILRSAAATRPALRILPAQRQPKRYNAAAGKRTRGVVKVTAGDQANHSDLGNEPDLGTAFALATSFLGNNHLQVTGNVGYASAGGAPSTAIRTSYRRELAGSTFSGPEVKLTMRQAYLPARANMAIFAGLEHGAPSLRTLSAAFFNEARPLPNVRFEYGAAMDSVSFIQNLHYFSPFARLTVESEKETLQLAYASGTPPAELFLNEGGSAVQMQEDVSAVSLFPRVSIAGGRARVQRTQSIEIGYRRTVGSRTYSAAVHRQRVRNAAITAVGPEGFEPGGSLLPDLFSRSWVMNAGDYGSYGYTFAVTQSLGSNLDVTAAYGNGGALTADAFRAAVMEELRDAVRTVRRHSLTTRVSGTIPRSGTQFATSYQWANVKALTPSHLYLTQRTREGLGLNLSLRQPLPMLNGMPGRVEANAELRNLLEQGYVPAMVGDRPVVLMHTPRTVRGGVSFIF